MIFLKLLLSVLLGGAIGLERQMHGHSVGIRTSALISMGACLAAIISMRVCGDPGRISAQVISGIGFIGAGIIWKSGLSQVHGLTTAVITWVAGIIGLACGCDLYTEAVETTVLEVFVLIILNKYKPKGRSSKTPAPSDVKDTVETSNEFDSDRIGIV